MTNTDRYDEAFLTLIEEICAINVVKTNKKGCSAALFPELICRRWSNNFNGVITLF